MQQFYELARDQRMEAQVWHAVDNQSIAHFHSAVELILVEEGCGTVTVGEETLALQEGDVAFLDCHQPYSHCCDAREPWKILWVHWNGQVMPHLYEVFRQRNVSVVLGGAADWVEPVLLRLESIAREEAPDYELYESECLTQLMTLLLTKKPERGGHASG